MLIKMKFQNLKEIVSPYICKKVMERVYKDENFKYLVDKILYLTEPQKNEQNEYEMMECVVFVHTRSTHKSAVPIITKKLEQKILKKVEQTTSLIHMDGKESDATVTVSLAEKKEMPVDFSLDVPDMMLEVIVTKARHVMMKVIDGHIVHGTLPLQDVKPRTVRPKQYEWVAFAKE